MTTTIILGTQWGDEGKGKLTDILCADAQICARASVSHSEILIPILALILILILPLSALHLTVRMA